MMSNKPELQTVAYNILIVDDIPANLKVLGEILKGNGYKVRPVPNGALALQVAEKERPDLILLDVMMPDMDGYEVCRRLKDNDLLRDIPVIFISALNDTQDIVTAFTSGGVDYITKPFKAEEVKARVATHIKICQQNRELQKLNADKDRFISILSHDLKSPFHLILGFLGLLSANVRKYDISKIETQLQIIHHSAQGLNNLLEDILLWTRTQSGNLPYEPQKLNLLEICTEVTENLSQNATAKNIQIDLLELTDTEVFADNNMIKTIIRNLVSNAIKFTNRDGQIQIGVSKNENEITISIADNGVGIKPTILAKLFDISQKISTVGTESEQGTGFGLFVCKEFVQKHGGTIWAETELGKGSEFKFTLPHQTV